MATTSLAGELEGQSVSLDTAGAAVKAVSRGFTSISDVRELNRDLVLVIDSKEAAVKLVDFSSDTTRQLGQQGDGPGEYRMPSRLIALRGGRTLLVDSRNLRISVLDSTHRIQTFQLSAGRGDAEQALSHFHILAADTLGFLYAEGEPWNTNTRAILDSSALIRLSQRTGSIDTIAMLRMDDRGGRVLVEGVMLSSVRPFRSWDQWAVSSDGHVAIVRLDPFRVEFINPKGVKSVGPVLQHDPIRVTEREKEEWLDTRARSPVPLNSIRPQWPQVLPPFRPGAAQFAPDGMLWLGRTVPAGKPAVFDLINRHGVVVRRVVVPKGTRFLGFGQEFFYTVRIDDDGLEYLQQHRLK